MLFKSGLVTQVSGSVGGITGSRNKGGFYLKARSVPTNPATPSQVAARLRFQTHSAAWTNLLTEAQRVAWNDYAEQLSWTNPLGDAIQLSGQNVFVGSNSVLEQGGLATLTAAPAITSQPALDVEYTGVSDDSPAQPSFTIPSAVNNEWAATDDAALLIFISRARSAGTTFFKGPYQLAGTVAGDAARIFPENITLLNTPFTYVVGDRVFCQARAVMPDGRYSFNVSLGSQIVA